MSRFKPGTVVNLSRSRAKYCLDGASSGREGAYRARCTDECDWQLRTWRPYSIYSSNTYSFSAAPPRCRPVNADAVLVCNQRAA